jgi:GNAT superfamily N-acetyltransferase
LHDLAESDRKRLARHPVPAMRMGRLAVAQAEQGRGYGQLLVGHAANLAVSVRQTLGVRVLIVDAKDAKAAAFYQPFGFRPTASAALTLNLPVGTR